MWAAFLHFLLTQSWLGTLFQSGSSRRSGWVYVFSFFIVTSLAFIVIHMRDGFASVAGLRYCLAHPLGFECSITAIEAEAQPDKKKELERLLAPVSEDSLGR